jgi:hypothetical protein
MFYNGIPKRRKRYIDIKLKVQTKELNYEHINNKLENYCPEVKNYEFNKIDPIDENLYTYRKNLFYFTDDVVKNEKYYLKLKILLAAHIMTFDKDSSKFNKSLSKYVGLVRNICIYLKLNNTEMSRLENKALNLISVANYIDS